MRGFQYVLIAALGFAVASVARAEGTPLAPGTFGPPLPSGFGGTLLLDSGSNTFSSGGLAGTLFWEVWSDSANSVLVGNEFAYHFVVTGSEPVHRMTVNNWDLALTNVATSPFAGDGTPATSADRSLSGGTIGWDFGGSVLPGGASSWLVVFTNGTTINPAIASFIDGASVSVSTVSLVPEPDTYAMIVAGIGLLGFIARRRRRAASVSSAG